MKKLLARLTFLTIALAPALALAQTYNDGVRTQASPTKLDATTFIQAASNGATSCNTVSETAAQDTITITPPAGLYVYITGYYGNKTTDATGVTETLTVSTTNITGSPIWAYNTALSTVGSDTVTISETFNPPLKSATVGVAVTFVPSATQSAHSYLCHRVAGYFAP